MPDAFKEMEAMDAQHTELARKVRAARKERKWTQQYLAELAGVTLGVINNFERCITKPQPANLRAILHAVDLDSEAPVNEHAPDVTGAALDICPNCGRVRWPETYELMFDILGAHMDTLDALERREFMIRMTAPILTGS